MTEFYDYTKGGSNIVGQRMGFYTCKTKSRRLTSTAFAYVLDPRRVNAATVFALNHKQDPQQIEYLQLYQDVSEIAD